MTQEQVELLPVIQADRDAAVELMEIVQPNKGDQKAIKAGSFDVHPYVRAFARHRIATRTASVMEMRGALEAIREEAERENGGWVHLKRVIASRCRQALSISSKGEGIDG